MKKVNNLKSLDQLKEVIKKHLETKESIIMTSQSKDELGKLVFGHEDIYRPKSCLRTSYEYINKFYGFRPIFAFRITKDNLEYLDDIIRHMPNVKDVYYMIISPSEDEIQFEGEYYNWSDFHGTLNDTIGHVPETRESLITEWRIARQVNDDYGLSENLIMRWSTKEGFEADMDTKVAHNFPATQLMLKSIKKSDIVEVLSVFNLRELKSVELTGSCLLDKNILVTKHDGSTLLLPVSRYIEFDYNDKSSENHPVCATSVYHVYKVTPEHILPDLTYEEELEISKFLNSVFVKDYYEECDLCKS